MRQPRVANGCKSFPHKVSSQPEIRDDSAQVRLDMLRVKTSFQDTPGDDYYFVLLHDERPLVEQVEPGLWAKAKLPNSDSAAGRGVCGS
jgi:hypothetical protein